MRSSLGSALLFTAILACTTLAPNTVPLGHAQEKKDEPKAPAGKADPAKQKAKALAILKQASLDKSTIVETDNFLIACPYTEEKAKVLGSVLEKVVPVARKALQFEEKEEAWKGKLTIFVIPDTRDFKSFMRTVVMQDPKGVFFDLRTDEPFVADPVDVGSKASEADQFAGIAATVAAAFLKARGNTASMPDWLEGGFARVTAMRAEGTGSARYTKYKTAARTAIAGPKGGKGGTFNEVWGETKVAATEVLANSAVEYMAYGPGAMNFIKLVYGFRPNEQGDTPATPQAMEAAGWKDIAPLEAAWRKWALAK